MKILFGVLRHMAGAAGAVAVVNGDDITQAVGAVMTAISVIGSIVSKVREARKNQAKANPYLGV